MYIPKIYKSGVATVRAIRFIDDNNSYMDTKTLEAEEFEFYDSGSSICLDFGRHITGYFKFELGQYNLYLDAPVKLKIKFAETPYAMRRDFSTYKGGLSSSWLQEEIITVDTLAECMQDVLEDGPKRDRRLWLGDLRLQALANYYTFENMDIVRRCLYLFAAYDSEYKLLPSYVYTKPSLETGDAHLVSYALLFTVALCDYFEHIDE